MFNQMNVHTLSYFEFDPDNDSEQRKLTTSVHFEFHVLVTTLHLLLRRASIVV